MMHRSCRLGFTSLVVVVLVSAIARGQLRDGDFVAICGDSITEQRRYSVFIEDYLLMCQPKAKLRAMQFGWSGEVAPQFAGRMSNDVLRYHPTVATTCYGMNDGGYAPYSDQRGEQYRKAMTQIVQTFRNGGVRFIVVGSPGVVDPVYFNRPPGGEVYNDTLSRLRDIAQDVAREQGVAFADVYTAMMQAMKSAKAALGEKYEVAGSDGFHPNNNGGLIMAYAFLKAMGCDGDIGTITVDLASGGATATEGHKVLSSGGDGIEIESTRYPFCFSKSPDGQADSPASTRQIIRFFPFNEELNRLRLVVNNAGAPRLRVTWGSTAKEFSADELAKGINLAAEFLDNPFSEQFAKVESLIRNHQGFEIPMIKSFVTKMAQFNEMAPGNQDCLDRIEQGMARRRESMVAEAAAAVVPVRHVIRIEKLH